ncbi:MAG: glycosyltransferase [bacterium]|nr:glycosyltransferase [bacterium]
MKKISLLYTRTGGGHLSLALATQEALEKYSPEKIAVSLFDPHHRFYAQAYEKFGSSMQGLWKAGYQASASPQASQLIHKMVIPTVINKLAKYLQLEKPDLIVSNHAFITVELKMALVKIGSRAKTAIYFADPFSLHPAWLAEKGADLYLAPTQEAADTALAHGIPRQKVKVVGWLTRDAFFTPPHDRQQVLTIMGLATDKMTIFVGGSGQGGGKTYELCQLVSRDKQLAQHCQLVVNTGLNSVLANKVIKLTQKNPQLFYILPYSKNLSDIMSACDLVMGKAGPNFLFEALHLGKPIIATGCLPGQEDGNLEYITRSGIGWVKTQPQSVIPLLKKILKNPQLLQAKKDRMKVESAKHRHTAKNLAHELHLLLK